MFWQLSQTSILATALLFVYIHIQMIPVSSSGSNR